MEGLLASFPAKRKYNAERKEKFKHTGFPCTPQLRVVFPFNVTE